MQVAFLGLGQMGAAIARLLVEKGHNVIVWNRSAEAAKPLVDCGASLAGTPADAVASAEIVFTMLFDDGALEEVLFDRKTLEAMPAGSIHVSLSTISVALADRLASEHAARHQRFLSAPVFGRPGVAAEGKLWLVVAGAEDVVTQTKPILESISRGLTVVGKRPSQANVVKLAGNFLIGSMIASFSEAVTVAESRQIDPTIFLDTMNKALFQSPFVEAYSKTMLNPPDKAGATLRLGDKDTKLFREAALPGKVPTHLADLYQHEIDSAIAANLGDEDWAAGYLLHARQKVGQG